MINIEALMPTAKKAADLFKATHPHLYDELLMLAYEELTVFANTHDGEHKNPEAIVFLRCKGACKNFVVSDCVVHKPRTRDLVDPDPEEDSLTRMPVQLKKGVRPIIVSLSSGLDISGAPRYTYDEYDLIKDFQLEPLDRVIVEKRLDGWTVEEIAQVLELDHSTVVKRLTGIKRVLLEEGFHPREEPEEKIKCNECGLIKSSTEFYTRVRGPNQRRSYFGKCKECMKKRREKRNEQA
jgi:hypothetical protein